MRAIACFCFILALAGPGSAQVLPTPGYDNPRIQSVRYTPNEEVVLTALPETALTVVLEPSEEITRIVAGGERSFEVRVSGEPNSFQVTPLRPDAATSLEVDTNQRTYRFSLRVDSGLTAAYLVRFDYGFINAPPLPEEVVGLEPGAPQAVWAYRLKGDREVRPASIEDDGRKTRIAYGEGQALPAVFAIGPTGDEEVVNGYMRDGLFVIDRVYERLVFRINESKATARRNSKPESEG